MGHAIYNFEEMAMKKDSQDSQEVEGSLQIRFAPHSFKK